MIKTFPTSTNNPAIPAGSFLIGEVEHKIWHWVTTYYIHEGRFWVATVQGDGSVGTPELEPWPRNICVALGVPLDEIDHQYAEWLNRGSLPA